MLQILVALAAVTIDFPSTRVVIRLDKRVVMGSVILTSEPHLHEVPADELMSDGLARLTSYLALNGWPDISAEDRATLLNVTNAARGANEQAPLTPLEA